MVHNILITGGSGYLGGTLLARLATANLPPGSYEKIYALVRTDAQTEAVKQYGTEPLNFDATDDDAVRDEILKHRITVVFHLIGALNGTTQASVIKALAEVQKSTGEQTHFLHTSGAKLFSEFADLPIDRPIYDDDPRLYDIQKAAKPPLPLMQEAVATNYEVIELAEEYGVKGYIFVPCIVYGEGEGFGNKISIQTVAIVCAARETKRVYRTDIGRPTWPVCHVIDNTTLYLQLLRKILANENPPFGKNGYYLASPGSVAWDDIYDAMAVALVKRGIVEDAKVEMADEATIERMGKGMGYPTELVRWGLGGKCTFTASRGKQIGWKPAYQPEHIVEAADVEVDIILKNLKRR